MTNGNHPKPSTAPAKPTAEKKKPASTSYDQKSPVDAMASVMLALSPMPQSDRNARVITVLNLKGGVGKTHTSWLLASVCQERGQRILLVDLDTQANLTGSFLDGRPEIAVETLFDPAADADAERLIHRTVHNSIDILPSSPRLARFDLADQRAWEAADLHLSLVDPIMQLRPQYDYIVFDCPPRLSLVSFAALCASDDVIIPLEAADWGAQGIMQVTEAIRYVQKRFNRRLDLLGYLVSRFKRSRTYQKTYLEQLRQHFGEQTFDTVLIDGAQFERSVTDRLPVTIQAPRSSAAALARQFFDEVEARIKRRQGRSGERRQAHPHKPSVAVA
jgi:chromosome partitioning protein